MESLYHQTNKLLQETQNYFARLEQTPASSASAVEQEIQSRIDAIASNCERLDILVAKEPVTRRTNGRIRIDQLSYDNKHMQAALRNFQDHRCRRQQEEQEREDLLNRKFTYNSAQDGGDITIMMDHSLQHHSSLQNSNRNMDDMLRSGSGILESLRDQRGTIKGAQRRILDIANTLGLSNTTMRLIERRASQDKFVLLGGMLLTCVVIVLVVVYLT